MLQPNDSLDGRYIIAGILGSGGQGVVYLATDAKLGVRCAIKEIDLTRNHDIDLLAEPEILKQLRHPSLPHINDIIKSRNYLYIVEEFFEGVSLKDLIPNRNICNEENVVRWIKELCQILQYLHSIKPNPIIYRDMKPGNIIIDREGQVRLIDFGIAREFKMGKDSDTKYIGTRGYAAPEQYGSNQTDARTDIYSLGVTMYHVITGKSPLEPPYEFLPIRQVNPNLSEGLETIIQQCVRVDPAQRYQSAAQLLDAINNIHTMNKTYRNQKNRARLAAAIVVILLTVSVLGVAHIYQSRQDAKKAEYEEYLQAGVKAYRAGNFSQAETQFNKAMKINPEEEVYVDLARTYLSENQNEKVISFLQENVNNGKLKSDNEIQYLTGTACYNLQDYQKAVWYFKEAVKNGASELGEDYSAAYRDLAVSYAKSGDYDKAQEILDKITADDQFGKHLAHYINGELAVLKHDYNQARQEFETAVRLDNSNARYKMSLARLYLTLNNQVGSTDKNSNFKNAINILGEIIQSDPNNIMALNDLGKAYYDYGIMLESQGDNGSSKMYQQSLINFNKIAALGIQDLDVYINLGILYDKLGNNSEADRNYRLALEQDGNNSRANLVYGLFKLKQKDYSGAYQYLQKTVQLNKNAGEAAVAQNKINELREKGWIN